MLRISHLHKPKICTCSSTRLSTHSKTLTGKHSTHHRTPLKSSRQLPEYSKVCQYKHTDHLKLVQTQSDLRTLMESVQKDHRILFEQLESIKTNQKTQIIN
jgi:hypothetical protein